MSDNEAIQIDQPENKDNEDTNSRIDIDQPENEDTNSRIDNDQPENEDTNSRIDNDQPENEDTNSRIDIDQPENEDTNSRIDIDQPENEDTNSRIDIDQLENEDTNSRIENEDNLPRLPIDQPQPENTGPRIDVLAWGNVLTEQPLDPVVLSRFFTSRPAQPPINPPGDNELSSENSRTVHMSGSTLSLPSIDSNRPPSDGNNQLNPPLQRRSSETESTYSNQMTRSDVTDPFTSKQNPCMKRIVWTMVSVALMMCGAGVSFLMRAFLESSGIESSTQPVTDEASSESHQVFNMDVDMGTS